MLKKAFGVVYDVTMYLYDTLLLVLAMVGKMPRKQRKLLYKAATAVGLAISAKLGLDSHSFLQWVETAIVFLGTVGAPVTAHRHINPED